MTNILVFDTETSGLVDFNGKPTDKNQPEIVQLAAMLCTPSPNSPIGFTVAGALNFRIRPSDTPPRAIHPKAFEAHGLSNPMLLDTGMPRGVALQAFQGLLAQADTIVAHNIRFDAMALRAAWFREYGEEFTSQVEGKTAFCTMKATIPIVKVLHKEPKHAKDYKWPKLQEAHVHFFGEEFQGAHDAFADVFACAKVYFAVQRFYAERAAAEKVETN